MVNALVPPKGALVVLVRVFVDETNTHAQAPTMAVAGYIFTRTGAKIFTRKFSKKLHKYGLPYFHMKECAVNTGVFGHMTDKQCDEVARKLIECTRNYSEYGFAVSLHKDTYKKVVPATLENRLGSEYSFCLRGALILVRRWIERNRFTGDVAYFFESGAKHEGEANLILTDMFENEVVKKVYHHASHAFVEKRKFPLLAPADMFAWLYQNALKKEAAGKPMRKDFAALLRPQDMKMDFNETNLTEMFDRLRAGRPWYFD